MINEKQDRRGSDPSEYEPHGREVFKGDSPGTVDKPDEDPRYLTAQVYIARRPR
jgi:hypothetical protein